MNSSFNNISTALSDGSCKPFAGDSFAIKAFKILLYSLLLIASLVENSVIIATVARNKQMQTTINYLIANMAASDLLISTFAVPIQLSEIVLGPRRWLLRGSVGLISCKLGYFLQDISSTVSVQSLVVIAIDRYQGIVFPFRQAIITPKRCKVIIPLVWLYSMGLHSIYFYTVRLVSNDAKTYCIFNWEPDFHPRRAQERYIVVVLVLNVVLPFFVITALYSQIIGSLRREKVANCSLILRQRHKENTKVFKYTCAIMAGFYFCILPVSIYGILCFFVWKWKIPCNMEQLGFAVHFILFSNAAISPLINFVFNERYRKGLKAVFRASNFCHKDEMKDNAVELNVLEPR